MCNSLIRICWSLSTVIIAQLLLQGCPIKGRGSPAENSLSHPLLPKFLFKHFLLRDFGRIHFVSCFSWTYFIFKRRAFLTQQDGPAYCRPLSENESLRCLGAFCDTMLLRLCDDIHTLSSLRFSHGRYKVPCGHFLMQRTWVTVSRREGEVTGTTCMLRT